MKNHPIAKQNPSNVYSPSEVKKMISFSSGMSFIDTCTTLCSFWRAIILSHSVAATANICTKNRNELTSRTPIFIFGMVGGSAIASIATAHQKKKLFVHD